MKNIIPLLASALLLGICTACVDKKTQNEEAKTQTESSESVSNSSTSIQTPTPKPDTFIGGDGTEFDTERVLQRRYQAGLSEGSLAKSKGWPKNDLGHGTERAFKQQWVAAYGVPNNEKAKEVYNTALQKYIQGYNDGYNF